MVSLWHRIYPKLVVIVGLTLSLLWSTAIVYALVYALF